MSYEERDIDILRVQLKLTLYEALTFVNIIDGKGQPSIIADAAGIPRPKVYGSIESLENKGLVVKTPNGIYQPDFTRITSLRDEADDMLSSYTKFIEKIYFQSIGPDRLSSHVKNEIINLLIKMDYKYELSDKISETIGQHEKDLIRKLSSRIQWKLEHGRSIPFGIARRIAAQSRNLPESYYRVPDIVIESPTSGMRTGIIIDSEREDMMSNIASIEATLYHIKCNAGIIVSPSTFELKEESLLIPLRLMSIKDYTKALENYLNEVDTKWTKLKASIEKLETSIQKEKDKGRELMNRVEALSKNSDKFPPTHINVYDDILSRIRHDIESTDLMVSQVNEHINKHFEYLEMKDLFPLEDLTDIEERIESISKTLQEKDDFLGHFEEEIYSIPSNINEYSKYGLKLNPFSLLVPLENTNSIINQKTAADKAIKFLSDVMYKSDSNFLLITGESGIGKSHFLNYILNEANDIKNTYGKAVAVKVSCKPNRDILYLYPQIIEGLKKALYRRNELEINQIPKVTENLKNAIHQQVEQEFFDVISKISNNEGVPTRIQDLMKILRKFEELLRSDGFDAFLIIIDEFENSLPRIHEHQDHSESHFMPRRKVIPSSISQLYSLLKLSGIGFIVSLREEDWSMWQNEIENRFGNKNIINLEALSLEDSKSFLRYRLDGEEYRSGTSQSQPITLSDDFIEQVWKSCGGNPRKMLQMSINAFRKAVKAKSNVIEPVITT